MRVLLTTSAKEDIAALALIDEVAHQRLHTWLQQLCNPALDNVDATRLHFNASNQDMHLPVFSWPLSDVHRAVFAKHGADIVLLQCRFHF